MAVVLCQDEPVRLLYVLRAQATRVLPLPLALPSLPAAAAHLAGLFHAQPATANRLTRALVSHPVRHDPLCHADQAYPLAGDPHPLDSSPEPAPDCPPRARQHELAAEHSLDLGF
jgi:hypothetical protein